MTKVKVTVVTIYETKEKDQQEAVVETWMTLKPTPKVVSKTTTVEVTQ
jgi:hypothetical protein